jgi:hypothetical protein
MIDEEFQIALGVPRSVEPGKRVGRRTYWTAPDLPSEMIPEEVVLHRWRRKKSRPGVIFKGTRLPPGTWRAILECHRRSGSTEALTPEAVRRAIDRLDAEPLDPGLRYPTIDALRHMVAHLERRRALEALLTRHERDVDRTSPGIPDLFLYSLEADGRLASARFVEVKRPGERLLPAQVSELKFLKGLGLRAGVVRLQLSPTRAGSGNGGGVTGRD